MREFAKKTVVDLMGKAGVFPARETPRQDVLRLIRQLNPVQTGRDLIRLGPDGDGGYLVPDDLEGLEACFSPGVYNVSDFEYACAERGMQVFMADRSVDGPALEHDRFQFIKKYVGSWTNDEFISMNEWIVSSVGTDSGDLILQMDIEGFEYESIISMSDSLLRKFRLIIIEFHNLEQLWNRPFFRIASRMFSKLLETHECVHVHPNNCCGHIRKRGIDIPVVMEFTFIRKDRIDRKSPVQRLPHGLDRDNLEGMAPLHASADWFGRS